MSHGSVGDTFWKCMSIKIEKLNEWLRKVYLKEFIWLITIGKKILDMR